LVTAAAAAALRRSPAPPGRTAAPIAQPGRTAPASPAPVTPPTTLPPAPPGPPVMPTGCPPPPRPPQPPANLWHPPVLVPEAALPAPAPAAPRVEDISAVFGKGVWTWKVKATEGGDVDAIVARAMRTGLQQL